MKDVEVRNYKWFGANSSTGATKKYAEERTRMEAMGYEVMSERTEGVVNKQIVVTYRKRR